MKNRLKQMLSEGKVAVGPQLRFGSPAITELFACAGFDFVILDCEHAPQTPTGIQAQLQAVAATTTTALVRLTRNDPDEMRVYLDMGALGIVAPFVKSAEEAARGASGLRYPPKGVRGFGPARASQYGLDANYFEKADENMLYVPMIEDVQGIENIEGILAEEGVDTFILGPCDLSISLGAGLKFENKAFTDALKRVVRAAESAEKPAGVGVIGDLQNPDTLKRYIDMGFRLLLAGGDEPILALGCSGFMDTIDKAKKSSYAD